MPDPITIVTLVTVIITGISQIAQIYLDYKHAEQSGHSEIYKVYNSSCCNTLAPSDDGAG